jgi:cytidine deaminase
MHSEIDDLIAAAQAARALAYAPYSGFTVGAALLMQDGRMISGGNVENASYGLTLCAERTALARALAERYRSGQVRAIAIASGASSPTMPCGACRQWLIELAPMATVHCVGGPDSGRPLTTTVAELLPFAFGRAHLGR